MPNWRYPEFDWDDGNVDHIIERHDVYPDEAEEVFYSGPLIESSGDRYEVSGQTRGGRYLLVVCTWRGRLLRVITARDMNRTERKRYERHS